MWGAKSGKEQLAPFPEPTHAAGFACAVPNSAKQCVVGFTSKEAFDKAHKMVRCRSYCSCCLSTGTLAGVHNPMAVATCMIWMCWAAQVYGTSLSVLRFH